MNCISVPRKVQIHYNLQCANFYTYNVHNSGIYEQIPMVVCLAIELLKNTVKDFVWMHSVKSETISVTKRQNFNQEIFCLATISMNSTEPLNI